MRGTAGPVNRLFSLLLLDLTSERASPHPYPQRSPHSPRCHPLHQQPPRCTIGPRGSRRDGSSCAAVTSALQWRKIGTNW